MLKNDAERARELYIKSNKKMKLTEIAKRLGRSPGTVRSWKYRDEWDGSRNKENKIMYKQINIEERLTEKQKMFCAEYVKILNATKAYQWAYGCDHATASTNGSRLLSLDKIKENIQVMLETLRGDSLKESAFYFNKDILDKMIQVYGNKENVQEVIEKTMIAMLPKVTMTEEEYKRLHRRDIVGKNTRYEVMARAGFKCQACGAKTDKDNDVTLHIDHITPRSLGGSDSIHNLQVLCESCNISKGNRFNINHNINWNIDKSSNLKEM